MWNSHFLIPPSSFLFPPFLPPVPMPSFVRVFWLPFILVLVDQATKLAVRLHMFEGESIPVVGRLFQFTYTQNPGMAFGLSLGSKTFLTIFSVVATVLIAIYLWHVRRGPAMYRTALALVLGGAFGNAIDRVFYGAIWSECAPSPPEASRLLYGCVVDFLHLNVWNGEIGGRYISLFPIGNVADVAIMVGIVLVLLSQGAFQRHVHAEEAARVAAAAPVVTAEDRVQESM